MTEVHLLEITEIPDFDAARAENKWIVQAQKEWYSMGLKTPASESFIEQYLTAKRKHTRFFYLASNLFLANIQVIKRF